MGDQPPLFPSYAVGDTEELNVGVPIGSKDWRVLGRLTIDGADKLREDIVRYLKSYSNLSDARKQLPRQQEEERVATLFVGDNEAKFLESKAFKAMSESVCRFGVLFLDTEFVDAETLKSFGCRQEVSSGTVEIVQLGSLSGHSALLQVNYDCRDAHGCVCDKRCKVGKCDLNILSHKAWQYRDSFKTYGVKVPTEVITWLEDPSIIKVQSGIVNTDGSYGDLERLQMLLGIKVCSYVELQNLTLAWFPQRTTVCNHQGCDQEFGFPSLLDQHMDDAHGGSHQKRSGNGFLAERMGIVRADHHYRKILKSPIWSANRRKPFNRWPAALKFYDLSDVMVPAVFLLKIGIEVTKLERATCSSTSIVPYLRQVLLLYKDEPSLVVKRRGAPAGKCIPFRDWSGYNCDDIIHSEAKSFPWRPGFNSPSGFRVEGPIISRNLRQLASELIADVYKLGLEFEDLDSEYRPPLKFANRLSAAKDNWMKEPVCEAPAEQKSKSNLQLHRFEYVQGRAESRKRKREEGSKMSKRPRYTPNHKMTRPVYFGHCFRCGAADHGKKRCQIELKCLYPLCSTPSREHDTRVCDTLHNICGACRLRGHKIEDHLRFDLVSLIKLAVAWAPVGLLTSLPILAQERSFWRQPSNEEFHFDPFNQVGRFRYYEKNIEN